MPWRNELTALQKAQESQKAELEGIIRQAAQLNRRIAQQETLAKQLDESKQKVATISGSDAKTWLLAQADFLVNSPDGSCGAIRMSRPLQRC